MSTLKDVAEAAGVSVPLVSRLLSGDPALRVREDKRQRILRAVRDLKYRRPVRGKRRSPRQARPILLPIHRVFTMDYVAHDRYLQELLTGLRPALEATQFRLELAMYDEAAKREQFAAWTADPSACAGIILLSGTGRDGVAELLIERQVPHVSVDYRDMARGLNVVCDDIYHATGEQVRHLVGLGHERIGFIGSGRRTADRVPRQPRRFEIFEAVMAAENRPHDPAWDCVVPSPEKPITSFAWHRSIREALQSFFSRAHRPTAAVCVNDGVALDVLDAMAEAGLRPGRDISVVGYEDVEAALGLTPRLTTTSLPLRYIGARAAARLAAQFGRDPYGICTERYRGELVVRESTGPVPTGRRAGR